MKATRLLPRRYRSAIRRSVLWEMFFATMQTLADETVPDNKEELEKLRKNLDQVLGIGNRECARLVWAASDFRKSQIRARNGE